METTNQVIEVVQTTDYTEVLGKLLTRLDNIEYATQILSGFALFLVVVCLCYFCYKFFRIFI